MRAGRIVFPLLVVACGKVNLIEPDAPGPTCDPTFTVSADPMAGMPVSFSAVHTDGATYTWSFDGDATPGSSTDEMPTTQWVTGGDKQVTLTVTNGSCTMTSMQTVSVACTGMVTFSFTGDVQMFQVPMCTSTVTIDALGAAGGDGEATNVGGMGGEATGTATVTPGETLTVYVGGQGIMAPTVGSAAGFAGGFNGGGHVYEYGGWATTMQSEGVAGTGGGASDVRRGGTDLASRIIVAGGGGGGSKTSGGGGGGTTGVAGTTGTGNAIGGGGGTQSAGGTTTDCCGGYPNTPGALGVGGDGYRDGAGSGGGGGGYYGGGGGQFAAGGGGSSYIVGLANATTTAGVQPGNGQIIISW
jgi:hypothetical protein